MLFTFIILLAIFLFGGYILLKFFNRDPERHIPQGNLIVSPADGKIIHIIRIEENGPVTIDKGMFGQIKALVSDMGKGPFTLISIFMNPAVVHVQRVPISGQVVKIRYRPGTLRMANTIRAINNERSETLIESSIGKIKVIQVAGMLARRIETWVHNNEYMITGQRLGRITLGSQVSLLIPNNEDIILKTARGKKVKAGVTIIAEIKEENHD